MQAAVHVYVKVLTKCLKCGNTAWLIYEFGREGKEKHVGAYRRANNSEAYFECNRNFTYGMIQEVYEWMPSSGYDLIHYNCRHWAVAMYPHLYICSHNY